METLSPPRQKPMRLRVLELPSESVGDSYKTPFLLVVDRCNQDQIGRLTVADRIDDWPRRTGATTVLVFEDEVDLDA